MSKYAERTSVPISRSIDELGRIVKRNGASQWALLHASDQIGVEFTLHELRIQVTLPMPRESDFTTRGYEQEVRRLWRVLVLLIKARFELIDAGAESPEQAFMAYIRLPSGRTAGEEVLPQILTEIRPIALGAGNP